MTRIFIAWVLLGALISSCTSDSSQNKKDLAKPEPSRFNHSVVVSGLDAPLQMEFDAQGRVYWIERTGGISRIDETTGQVQQLGQVPLAEEGEGLIGILLDTEFEQNRQLYLFYSAEGDQGDLRLSRFTLNPGGTLDMNSEIVMLKIPWEQPSSFHFGGGMEWDTEGNLYLSVGGDTKASQYEPIHYLNKDDSTEVYDAARSAGNTNDLRGTILRITPQPDGSYTIPEGNLFEKGTPKTRPEIYTMGNRNPWRLSIDSETGYLHWGMVGPDAGVDSETYGPMGYDEFNVAKQAGNFGWPFVIGNNLPYPIYNYETKTYGELQNSQAPVNHSPNNTGLKELPPAQPTLVSYPYGVSEEWPVLGSAGRSAVGGPVFRQADFPDDAPRLFPKYYEGKWLVTDYVRNWIMSITMNEERTKATDIEPVIPTEKLSHQKPLDMDFGPNGDLYLLEYGENETGRISKYKYNDGNRKPEVQVAAQPRSGAMPYIVSFSSAAFDHDGDELTYQWEVRPIGDGQTHQFDRSGSTLRLENPGRYVAVLTVSDPSGATAKDSVELVAGNERPQVNIEITEGNRTFYFPDESIEYKVDVIDQEDGSLAKETIPADQVEVTSEYIPSGLSRSNLSDLQKKYQAGDQTSLQEIQTQQLISSNNCETCHRTDKALVGPAFKEVANKYSNTGVTGEELAQRILEGSEGRWGNVPMPPQAMLSELEARQIANYILRLSDENKEQKNNLPLQGRFMTEGRGDGASGQLGRFFSPDHETGSYVLHASYTDNGISEEDGLELTGEDYHLLRYPLLAPEDADFLPNEGITFNPTKDRNPNFIVSGQSAYIGYKQLDLTGINKIRVGALTRYWHWTHFFGAHVELRLGGPEGQLVGTPKEQFQPDTLRAEDGPFFNDKWDPPVELDVSQVDGLHDVYLVFRNSKADPDDDLLMITGIEFIR